MLFPGIVKAFDFFALRMNLFAQVANSRELASSSLTSSPSLSSQFLFQLLLTNKSRPWGIFSLSKFEISQIFTLKNVPRTSISVRFRRCSATVAIYQARHLTLLKVRPFNKLLV